MASRHVFVVGFCAALLVGPRTGDTGDAGSELSPRLAPQSSAALAQRVDAQLGVWSDFDEAVGWLRARAQAGDSAARYELAHLRFTGLIDRGMPGETVALLAAAAEAGQGQAQLLLARLHEFGLEGLAQDPVQALKWYERAAARAGTPDLREAASESRDRLRARLTSRQIAAAETVANLPWVGVRSVTSAATSVE